MGMMKNTGGGEIVQVQGGHIVRSTGRKDRHSKVFTAKGPRDRRVRLSAHTAIQFYDVQDRLGYDRPSKAVDWLIKKAKSAIDKLAELPPWHPTTTPTTTTTPAAHNNNTTQQEEEDDEEDEAPEIGISDETESSGYNFQFNQTNPENHSAFMTSQIDSDAIAFFPTISRNTNNPSEDLGLSLHSFQDSGLIHSQSSSQVAADANPGGFLSWNNVLVGQQGSSFAQRGTLQSSFSSAWNDIAMNADNNSNNSSSAHHNNNNNNNSNSKSSSSQASIFGSRFVSDGMGIHGFCIPARIQGEEEEDDHHGIASDHHHHHHHHHHRPASSASNSHR